MTTGKSTSLKEQFKTVMVPELTKALGLEKASEYVVPRVKYIKVNVGVGSYVGGGKDHEDVVSNVAKITGQRPVVSKSRMAISNFKLRQGTPNGVSVTLRGKYMYDFLTKLIHVVFPRIRDFRGISRKAFDGRGNYSVGISEHTVFPEISAEDVNKIHGIQVNIVTTAKNDKEGLALLKVLGFPFKKE